MLSYKIKLGIVPVRRDVTPRPGIFNWEFAEKRGREITDYIKAHFTDELTEFVDIEGVNPVNVMINFDDAEFIIDRFKKEKVDGVLAYASDPAAPTAAYVAEKMGLPGNPARSVEILCNKDQFRRFLSENGFHTPRAVSFDRLDLRPEDFTGMKFPVIIKPVDSSGSKGVSRADDFSDMKAKAEQAMAYSRCGRIIVEEYVEMYGEQVAGDGLSVDGQLTVACFGDDHFDASCDNPFVPAAATFPCTLPDDMQTRIRNEIQRLLTLLGMKTCTYNFDIRMGRNGNVYLMEIAPRSGGNYIPQIVHRLTGMDMVKCSILAAMGEKIPSGFDKPEKGYYAYYALHSNISGRLKKLSFPEIPGMKMLENHILVQPGGEVRKFVGANATMGIVVMAFENNELMQHMIRNPGEWIEMELE